MTQDEELDDVPSFTDAPSREESETLAKLGTEMATLDADIVELEHRLELKRKRYNELATRELPDYMRSIGQDRMGLPDVGVDLVMEDYCHANISADWPEERRDAAFKWLEDEGHGDLIKIELSYEFPRTAYRIARWLSDQIRKIKIPAGVRNKWTGEVPEPWLGRSVHWKTLTAFVKEQMRQGNPLPLDTLGATVGKVVKIRERKEK